MSDPSTELDKLQAAMADLEQRRADLEAAKAAVHSARDTVHHQMRTYSAALIEAGLPFPCR